KKETKKENRPPHPPPPPSSPIASSTNGPPLLYVSIPVDTQALKNLNQETALLDANLFEQLKDFNAHIANRPPSKESVTSKNTGRTVTPPSQPHIVVPRFPIFGQVRAGPGGEAYLDTSYLKADAIDETLIVTFEGRNYKVNFVNDYAATFVDGKQYGWLKVKGESMNNAINKPISCGDYILFHKNQHPDFCTGKIVVALLPETEAQPPHLVVKRLIKLTGKIPERTDGYGNELIKFILRSESLLDVDPETGDDYKKEISIFEESQLVGDVIAIAKPV
ncbi:MAG: S24 family peptidase, partial [Anaerolineales bacterium]